MRKALAILLAFLTPLSSQQVGQNTATQGQPTFQSTTQLVIETVVVKDKNGNPITGLTAKDFTITEDGVPQTIRFFEYQKLDESAPVQPIAETVHIEPYARLTKSQIAPEPPGDLRYRDRRLLALYFDLTAMPVSDQLRALSAAKKFLRTQLTTSDLVAVMVFQGGAVQVLQDFTNDRARLLSTIETLIVGEDENAPLEADTGAAFGQNESEFNVFFTDRQLAALQTAATMLGRLNEKKSLIYFASGLRLNGTNNQAQLHATINAAIRAGVSFWPVDARGLVAQAPLGDATQGSPGGLAMYTGGGAAARAANLQRSQDTLWTLGADTGGKALLDSNDLSAGIVQAQKSTLSYYILGYYTTNANPDGKFRKIKITLNNDTAVNLDYRQGYFASKKFNKFTTADKERQLEDALMLGDPITELTIAMEIDYFQLNRAEYFVPIAVKIPGSELALARRGGADHTLIDFIGEIKDSYGTTVSNVRDKVDIKLTGATAAELAKRPIEYDTGFTLLPGKYKIKFLARDAETGRIGTFESPFIIPNLNKEEQRIPISSVVLSSQRADLREALFNAKDKAQAILVNPLVQDGLKLIPSVTRVFSQKKDMFIYLQAYQQTAEPAQPLLAFVTFYKGQSKALETTPLRVSDSLTNRLKTTPIKFTFPLQKLQTGEYTCQVTVLEPKTRKAAFWQSQILLIP
ncbi:MAG: VWA domain-containing protein [Acidobacteria bacterium]|nr:VWA domain-containing protein [Acidobacteriota bacterium]